MFSEKKNLPKLLEAIIGFNAGFDGSEVRVFVLAEEELVRGE
jgi:hypothetical protein